MSAWFPNASLIWTTSTSYNHKLVFQIFKSNLIVRIPLSLTFSNGHTFRHRWPMRSNLQQSNSLDALFKSTRQQIFWKCDLNLPNMCFRLSIWPNGHRESHKYEFERVIGRTNEAAGIIIMPPNSAQTMLGFHTRHLYALYQLQVWSTTFTTWKAASCRSSARNPLSLVYTAKD